MQIAEMSSPAPKIRVTPSFALDLSWALHAATKEPLRQLHGDLLSLYDAHPQLVERVQHFWSEGPPHFTELEALAYLSGVLSSTDPARVLDAIAGACDSVPDYLAMASESDEDLAAYNYRLERLRADRRLRRRYMSILEEITTYLSEPWSSQCLPGAEATAEIVATQLREGKPWTDLTPTGCDMFLAHKPRLVEQVESGTPLLITVCAYFGTALYLEFDKNIVVGIAVEREDLASRARTEELARRLKVLADPTRLAIVDYVSKLPRSVGDITKTFRLAQPTVSNHIKVLREAGILNAQREGGRVVVQADRRAVNELIDRLGAVVS